MSYCRPPIPKEDEEMLSRVIGLGFAVYVFAVPLLLHWIGKFFGRPVVNFEKYGPVPVVLSLFFSLGVAGAGFCVLLIIYGDLYESRNERATWSFGQIVAVTLWLPVISKLFYLWICRSCLTWRSLTIWITNYRGRWHTKKRKRVGLISNTRLNQHGGGGSNLLAWPLYWLCIHQENVA
jgi:hypothetical protein